MRPAALGLVALSCLTAAPAVAAGGVPPNPFASNYPSAPPLRMERAPRSIPARRQPVRRPDAPPLPPADIPDR